DHDWLGPADAAMLMMVPQNDPKIGPWPDRHPRLVRDRIRTAKKGATDLLREHQGAVTALAAALETHRTMIDPFTIRHIARSASPTLPERATDDCWRVGKAWSEALAESEPGEASWILSLVGLRHMNARARIERDMVRP